MQARCAQLDETRRRQWAAEQRQARERGMAELRQRAVRLDEAMRAITRASAECEEAAAACARPQAPLPWWRFFARAAAAAAAANVEPDEQRLMRERGEVHQRASDRI